MKRSCEAPKKRWDIGAAAAAAVHGTASTRQSMRGALSHAVPTAQSRSSVRRPGHLDAASWHRRRRIGGLQERKRRRRHRRD